MRGAYNKVLVSSGQCQGFDNEFILLDWQVIFEFYLCNSDVKVQFSSVLQAYDPCLRHGVSLRSPRFYGTGDPFVGAVAPPNLNIFLDRKCVV